MVAFPAAEDAMHHIATVIYPTAPAPTTAELIAAVTGEFPDARVGESGDGLAIRLDDGVIYAELDEATPEQLEGAPERVDEAYVASLVGPADEGDEGSERKREASTVAEREDAELLLHLEGDFEDPADVIGLLEVFLRVRPDAKATGADGGLLPVSKRR